VVPSARAIVSEDHDQVMLDVVETYVNAPDHVGGTEPFIKTPGFDGSMRFPVNAPEVTRAKFVPSVIWLSMLHPWLGPSEASASRFIAS
jgi:hypothetical protein